MSIRYLDYLLWDNERTLVKVMGNVRVLIMVSDAMYNAKQKVFMATAQDKPLHVYARLSSTGRATRAQRVASPRARYSQTGVALRTRSPTNDSLRRTSCRAAERRPQTASGDLLPPWAAYCRGPCQ